MMTYFSELHIDLETYSEVDIKKGGVYTYVECPNFEITIMAYAFDDEPVVILDLANGDEIPEEVLEALDNPEILKWGHNSHFELACLSQHLGYELPAESWRCTMVASAYLGLPLSLDMVAKVLGLENQKDAKGKALIKYFACPCKPTKTNGGRTRNLPHHDPDKWAQFLGYCGQDVEVEREIHRYSKTVNEMPQSEWDYWLDDLTITRRGVSVDWDLVESAIDVCDAEMLEIHEDLTTITGLENPNSIAQLKVWLSEELGEEITDLTQQGVKDLLARPDISKKVAKVLDLRLRGSNTSVAKYKTMLRYKCKDGRIRGIIQFYGANRTGRFAGRAVQVQNLKRTPDKGLDTARTAVLTGMAPVLYDDVAELVSTLVRTTLIARGTRKIVSCDYSAVEARILAWVAGEDWVLDVFNTHGLLYEATASKMFGIPMEDITKPWRSKGKVASLALGYQGARGALEAMGALRSGLTEEELPELVRAWRASNPNIVKLWKHLEGYARATIKTRKTHTLQLKYTQIVFEFKRGYLIITLPSGRKLHYYGAHLDSKGKICFWGMHQQKKMWCVLNTYGGSLAENITQAIARDCLVEAVHIMQYEGVYITFHVHDEIVGDSNRLDPDQTLTDMQRVMNLTPDWAEGLPLSGEGYVSNYYKKD